MPSLLGNRTVVPTGTASTRGVNVLLRCSIAAGGAGAPAHCPRVARRRPPLSPPSRPCRTRAATVPDSTSALTTRRHRGRQGATSVCWRRHDAGAVPCQTSFHVDSPVPSSLPSERECEDGIEVVVLAVHGRRAIARLQPLVLDDTATSGVKCTMVLPNVAGVAQPTGLADAVGTPVESGPAREPDPRRWPLSRASIQPPSDRPRWATPAP